MCRDTGEDPPINCQLLQKKTLRQVGQRYHKPKCYSWKRAAATLRRPELILTG